MIEARSWWGGQTLPAVLPAALREPADRARHPGDWMFWQWPCRTEGAAWDLHRNLAGPAKLDGELHCYLGLPWATCLDRRRVDPEQAEVELEFEVQRLRIVSWRRWAAARGLGLRVHTVCQHIDWRALMRRWQRLGLTDVWLSHAPQQWREGGLRLHPWRLLAVNVEAAGRNHGLEPELDPAERPLLASFVGAHAAHYLSDVRLQLRRFEQEPGFVIRVGEGWHFEQVVYGHQIAGAAFARSSAERQATFEYNRLLSQSKFALCPSGAGPNTLRLWEALAVGAVPVLLGPPPRLPEGGSLAPIDWEAIVLRVADGELDALPERLRSIGLEELRERRRRGQAAFAAVRAQCCF